MFVNNPFSRIEGGDESNERLISPIASCICPGCGGALSLSLDQFRCQGRCGVDWRPLWTGLRQFGNSRLGRGAARRDTNEALSHQ
jgi:hypothetical protein